jgi:hypothetical protein
MNAAQIDRTLRLFHRRASNRTRIGCIEERGGKYFYGGKEIPL